MGVKNNMENFQYLKIKKGNNYINTEVPIKKDGIYYLSGKERYWLVSSGKKEDLQNPFIEKGIIGIGWDKVTAEEVKISNKKELNNILAIKYQNLNKFKEPRVFKSYISATANKLLRFFNEIKLGDIIVLKDKSSSNSNSIYFGKVISKAEEYLEKDLYVDEIVGYCNKIIRVKWLKSVERTLIGAELKLILTSRHALSMIQNEKVKDEVNREMFSYFYRGTDLHIVFGVGEENDIKYDSFKQFQDYIYALKEQALSIKEAENDFNIKANIQSPGPIEFFGNAKIIEYIYKFITENSAEIISGVGIVGSVGTYKFIKRILNVTSPKKEEREIEEKFKEGN